MPVSPFLKENGLWILWHFRPWIMPSSIQKFNQYPSIREVKSPTQWKVWLCKEFISGSLLSPLNPLSQRLKTQQRWKRSANIYCCFGNEKNKWSNKPCKVWDPGPAGLSVYLFYLIWRIRNFHSRTCCLFWDCMIPLCACMCGFGASPGDTPGSLLALHSRIISGRSNGSHWLTDWIRVCCLQDKSPPYCTIFFQHRQLWFGSLVKFKANFVLLLILL